MADFDALRPIDRLRLERFAAAFEDVNPLDYELFAGATASDEEMEAARAVARRTLGTGPRRLAVEHAVGSFVAAADRALARAALPPQILLGPRPSGVRTEDRIRVLQSLERAVVAVTLWDDLAEDERDILAGPWRRLVDRAVAEID